LNFRIKDQKVIEKRMLQNWITFTIWKRT